MRNKGILGAALIVLGVLVFSGFSYARGGYGQKAGCGDVYGCGDCGYNQSQSGKGCLTESSSEFKKFRVETLTYRQQASEKRFQLEKEYLAESPDKEKIAKLEKEMDDLRGKIWDTKNKYGVQAGKNKARNWSCCK